MERDYRIYVGIDWATQAHQACVLDGAGQILAERSFEHAGNAIAAFAQWLNELAGGDPEQVAIAIEVPRGAVVETLVERGFQVYAINPKQLDRFRDRYTVAGAKDDRRDAFVLGDSLRTDQPCFRRVRLDDPLVIQLRELSRVDEDLKREGSQLTNRLREQLHRFYAQTLSLCPAADEPWLWALLELAPSPSLGRRLRPQRVQRLLRQHRIRRLSAEEVVAALRTPALSVAPGVLEAATEHIALLLPRLRLVHTQRQRCGARIEALLDDLQAAEDEDEEQGEHRNVEILRSLPGVGRVVAATVLAEASGPWPTETTTACARTPGSRPSLNRVASTIRSSCAAPATAACVTPSITGRGSRRPAIGRAKPTTPRCASAAILTAALCAASLTGSCES